MSSIISFVLDGAVRHVDVGTGGFPGPTTTVLNFLRSLPAHRGVKEGCAEGDCGACTVVLGEPDTDSRMRYRAVDSCLLFLPMLHGKHLISVEDLAGEHEGLHPVQQAMVETNGSQCGYCTPGFVMSLFALFKEGDTPTREQIDDALTGNLCRCTGYRPIVEAAAHSCIHRGFDHFTPDEPRIRMFLDSIPPTSQHLLTPRQEYYRPLTLREALLFRRDHHDAVILNGATDVALRVTKRHELLPCVLDLSAVAELRSVSRDNHGTLVIGAGVCLTDLMPAVEFSHPALHAMLRVFGSRQIRNLATLGGNLGSASPIGDMLPVLTAYQAQVRLQHADGARDVPLDGFVTGYRTTRRSEDELITAVLLPQPPPDARIMSYKVSKRRDLDISTVSGGFRLERDTDDRVRAIVLAFGGMADRVKRAERTETALAGKPWTRDNVVAALPTLEEEFSPIDDARGSARFRRIAARNLLMKLWAETSGY